MDTPNNSKKVSKNQVSSTKMDKSSIFFISPAADVPESILNHYDINKQAAKNNSPTGGAYKNQLKAISEDFFERLDSRGKMIKIRRLHAHQEHLDGLNFGAFSGEMLTYPYSTFNLHPLSYVTQHDLKARANSLAYSKYKMIKRENAKKMAKKKRLMLMTVVKCKAFANIMKDRILKARERRRREEEEQKVLEARRRRMHEQAKILEKLTKENDDSGNTSGLSLGAAAAASTTPAGLIASESVGSLLTLHNQMNASLMIFGQQQKQQFQDDRTGSVKSPPVGLLS